MSLSTYNVITITYTSCVDRRVDAQHKNETCHRARGETINLRASSKQKAMIDRAAEALGRTRSDFMLDTACREAESVLLDRRISPCPKMRSSASPAFSIGHRRTIPGCVGSFRRKRLGADECCWQHTPA